MRTDFKIGQFRTIVSEWRIVAYVNYFVQGVRFVHFFKIEGVHICVSVQCLLLNSRCFYAYTLKQRTQKEKPKATKYKQGDTTNSAILLTFCTF